MLENGTHASILTGAAVLSAMVLIALTLFAFVRGEINWVALGIAGFSWSLLAGAATYFVNASVDEKMEAYYAASLEN